MTRDQTMVNKTLDLSYDNVIELKKKFLLKLFEKFSSKLQQFNSQEKMSYLKLMLYLYYNIEPVKIFR